MAEEEFVESWADLSVPELREELEARKLPTSGKKGELVSRLEEDDARRDAAGETEPTPEVEPEEPAGTPESDGEPPEPEEPTEKADNPDEGASDQESDGDGPEAMTVPGMYVVEVELPADADSHFDLEEPDMQAMQLEARQKAEAAGLSPLGGAFSARFVGESDGVARFEVPLR